MQLPVSTPAPTAKYKPLVYGGLLAGALALLLWVQSQHPGQPVFKLAAGAGLVLGVCYFAWRLDPAWSLAIAVFLSPIAGHWQELHIPGWLSPDRLLIVWAIATLALRAPGARDRPALREQPVHWVLGLASLYVLASAAMVGTLLQKESFFRLLEAYGILLFAVFYVAPAVFRDERRRRVLIGALTVLGAYLGLTALFETVHANALVWPRYISNPNVGVHFGRARGPFAEAVQNGVGLYTCAIGAVLGAAIFRGRLLKGLCLTIAALDMAGVLFTLQRSVWVGSLVATIVTFIAFKDLRRYLLPILLSCVLIGGAAYAVVGSGAVHKRATDQATVWDRYNLNRAALNMVEARPLFGYGWSRFPSESVRGEFFQQNSNYPLTAAGLSVHNEFFSHAAELGLVGLTLWLLGLLSAAFTAVRAPTPTPEAKLWKRAFVAYTVFYLVVSSFVPAALFPNLMFWLLAGIAASTYQPSVRKRATTPDLVPAR